jgi:hypothetical protein
MTWLESLLARCPQADFHIYLPLLSEAELLVQGDVRVFREVEKRLRRSGGQLLLHPVAPGPGPLHAKMACVVYGTRGRQRVSLMTGSPNMTSAALLDQAGNVETAWITTLPWDVVRPLLKRIAARTYRVKELKFEAPVMELDKVWMPLRSAVFDPMRHTLSLDWFRPADAAGTLLYYCGARLDIGNPAIIGDFELKDAICWLETRSRRGDRKAGKVPIEIPVDVLPACEGGMPPRTPEDWLRLLGECSAAPGRSPLSGPKVTGTGAAPDHESMGFPSSEKVRDLAARMRYLQRTVLELPGSSTGQSWMV